MASSRARKAANLSLDESLISQTVKLEQQRHWKKANALAIAEMNSYVEDNGLPLGKFRQI
ncbi:type II toxin-antitoxin system CcdA family antitoxin [Pararhizobium sp.]|uniref:type II toxin-antitoxin system CcdA family antitoxin n=1 Tax=Pararhizobium sp. TaxID=1977563 RepID=UPI002723AF06|nr:type II toxin-antitoxin system CcdA family antitoxin [Pararhizobium sp.]MDO9416138.1 type II toxin-antitoxin system CcdA family antitoxin [Pararhizobium sp.]